MKSTKDIKSLQNTDLVKSDSIHTQTLMKEKVVLYKRCEADTKFVTNPYKDNTNNVVADKIFSRGHNENDEVVQDFFKQVRYSGY